MQYFVVSHQQYIAALLDVSVAVALCPNDWHIHWHKAHCLCAMNRADALHAVSCQHNRNAKLKVLCQYKYSIAMSLFCF
jgi:hypothetical protein